MMLGLTIKPKLKLMKLFRLNKQSKKLRVVWLSELCHKNQEKCSKVIGKDIAAISSENYRVDKKSILKKFTISALSEKVTNDALSLPIEFRLELVDMLLKSLNIPTKPEIDELWAKETERRIDEVDSGVIQPRDGKVVFDKIRKRLRK